MMGVMSDLFINENEFIWENKFRPNTVERCILPSKTKIKAQKIIESGGDMQNMLFYSGPGTGKTTLAKAICKELDLDHILINGSREGRLIETVRNTVSHFANTMSITGRDGMKVVIYDEFDNAGDVQMAIRGLMDEVSASCRFIFTGNYVTKIIEPIQSRTTMIDFSVPIEEKASIMSKMLTRCCEILDSENILYKKSVLAQFIQKIFPDFRKILNELQAYSVVGQIDEGILEIITTRYSTLIDCILRKDFKGVVKWTNGNNYDSSIYSLITKYIEGNIQGIQWAEIIFLADEYQYRHNFATDPDITLWAFCLKVMGEL
jgi:replication factor C small subunit